MATLTDEQDRNRDRPDYCYLESQLVRRPPRQHPNPEAWAALRVAAFAEQDGKCATCPCPAEELHHRHYDTFGSEARADVVGLCRLCHDAITSRLREYRFGAGELSVSEIAEKVQGEKVEVFRPALSKAVNIPSPVNSEASDRFRPKQRTPFTPDKEG